MLLNADLGEGCGFDAPLFELVDMANIACGGHAGNQDTMLRACKAASTHGVLVGAHPSYPDAEGFGRRRPDGQPADWLPALLGQVKAFEAVCTQVGLPMHHIKPHGQLYNDAASDPEVARLVLELCQHFPQARLVALAGSPLVVMAGRAGLVVLEEAFGDRAYQANGQLVPRTQPGAVFSTPQAVFQQCEALANGLPISSADGSTITIKAQTVCVHGDSSSALKNAQMARQALGKRAQYLV